MKNLQIGRQNLIKKLLIAVGCVWFSMHFLQGCAGPATPLGGVSAVSSWELTYNPLSFIAGSYENLDVQIRFDPPFQILHQASPLTIHIEDTKGLKNDYRFFVRYNGLNVTTSFLNQARIYKHPNGRKMSISLPHVRLSPYEDHVIEVAYGNLPRSKRYARYPAPVCNAFEDKTIQGTGVFQVSQDLLETIYSVSRHAKLNPAFTAGLIAEKSGFDATSTSWSNALGLMWINAAEEERLSSRFPNWPRNPISNTLPNPLLRFLILIGWMNSDKDWRLDSKLAVIGGTERIKELVWQWSEPQASDLVRKNFSDVEFAKTMLIAASYEVGIEPIKAALQRHGGVWMSSPEMKEIRGYVNRVVSYCHYFSAHGKELKYEDKTETADIPYRVALSR